ncbi:MAG: glycosyltransferase [Oscillospiraceae bacterium]|jgi:glycosyltransferase involved in cell wall biosynthesis|nr:glycosyltransferase [Oscillospiraceae bacterium]
MDDEKSIKEVICTVLMISYNHEPYIRLAIESVISQKTQYGYIVHIFDDGSTDGTSDIIREYTELHPNFIIPFITEENRGAQQNIWEAYNSVDTKYCAFLECDDYWCDDEKLQLQIDALEENPDCSFCAHNTLYENDNDVYRKKENGKPLVINRNVRGTGKYSADDFKPLYGAGWVNHANSRLIRMSCVDLDKLEDKEDFLYDNAQFLYLLQRGKLFFYQRIMSVYVMNMSSTFTSLQVQKKISEHFEKMLHINESTNREFERLIYRHLGSFSFYWNRLDDIETKLVNDHSEVVTAIIKELKKLFLDVYLHYKLKKQIKKRIKELKNAWRS